MKTYLGHEDRDPAPQPAEDPEGQILDLSVDGVECDIKNTISRTGRCPQEMIGHPTVLIRCQREDRQTRFRRDGRPPSLLRAGKNQDGKKSVSAAGMGRTSGGS